MSKPLTVKEEIFRTPINPIKRKNTIDYDSSVVLLGSCFSENIGKKLSYYGFDTSTNPYGILFNPVSIKQAIQECVSKKVYTKNELFYLNEQYHSYHLHSNYSNSDSKKFLENINSTIKATHNKLKKASQIIITLGTASVYRLKSTDEIVANCHKVPQKEFSKDLLTTHEISNTLKEIINLIRSLNEQTEIIFTVSPIRHLKDGMIENSRSKANLISAIHASIDSTNCTYFPSFEIMNDDLRDYRFYDSDMIHPSQTAIEYIWKIFKEEWFSKNIESLLKEVETIRKGKLHRPFNPNSQSHLDFLEKLKQKEIKLTTKHNIKL